MIRLSHLGLAVDLPPGWQGQVYRRAPGAGEATFPVLHAATFALPADRGDYGSGAVEAMRPDDVFLALLEFPPTSAGTALFARPGPPVPLSPAWFSPSSLQRPLPGQGGTQVFFSSGGRAFCLYVVLGSFAARTRLVPAADVVLSTLAVTPLSGAER